MQRVTRWQVMRAAIAASIVVWLLFLGYLAYVANQIERESIREEARPADVIVVLGAAEYRGKPSPVLQARLNHALMLYLRGLAPYLLTTGGAGGDLHYTEADIARAYLIEHGVPSEHILADPEGATTAQSLTGAAEIMHRENLSSCIVVSDGYHIYRVKRLMQSQGIQVYGSPRPTARSLGPLQRQWLYVRQAAGFVLWQWGINI